MKLPLLSKPADAYAVPPSLATAATALQTALTDAEVKQAIAWGAGEAEEMIGGQQSQAGHGGADELENAAATARAAQTTALAAISRAERIKAALADRAVAADKAVIETRTAYTAEMAEFSNIAQRGLRIELEAAAAALAPVLAKAHALAAMRVMQFQHSLFESVINNAEHGTPAILQNS